MTKRRHRTRRKKGKFRPWMLWALAAAGILAALGVHFLGAGQVSAPPAWQKNVIPRQGKALSVAWAYRPTEFELPAKIDVQAPTWLYVEADSTTLNPVLREIGQMGYEGFDAAAYVSAAHKAGVKIWATVVSFDGELSRRVVENLQSRTEFAAALNQWAKTAGVDGVCLDFEKMDPADKEKYTQLVAACADALGEDITLSVAVTVPLGYEDETNWYQCYDRAGLAQVADYLALMAYDAHNSAVQPVAALPWVKRAVERTLLGVPSDQLLLGVPFYGVDFYQNEETEDPQHRVISAAALETLLVRGAITRVEDQLVTDQWLDKGSWQQDWSVMHYQFIDTQGYTHTIWIDSTKTLEEKGKLMDQYGLAGMAVWQQSQGTDELWKSFESVTAQSAVTPSPDAP